MVNMAVGGVAFSLAMSIMLMIGVAATVICRTRHKGLNAKPSFLVLARYLDSSTPIIILLSECPLQAAPGSIGSHFNEV